MYSVDFWNIEGEVANRRTNCSSEREQPSGKDDQDRSKLTKNEMGREKNTRTQKKICHHARVSKTGLASARKCLRRCSSDRMMYNLTYGYIAPPRVRSAFPGASMFARFPRIFFFFFFPTCFVCSHRGE